MGKQILILSGSPRKGGNSETLCAQFAKGAQEAGHTVELIRLHTKKLGFSPPATPARKPASASRRTTWPRSWRGWGRRT